MSRSVLVGLAATAATFAFVSAAWADNTAGMVGNTAVCTAPDGNQTKVYVEPGGRFTLRLPDGSTTKGAVKDDGSQICYTETSPASDAAPVCTPSVARNVGDAWTVDARGATQNCSLQSGKQ